MLPAIILVTALITSVISGVIGMAGGMILMAVLVAALSVPVAMVVHGTTQMVANGFRAWLSREHIRLQIIGYYMAGALLLWLCFQLLTVVPSRGTVLILIGIFPFINLLVPARWALDISRPSQAFIAGVTVTSASLLAGVSGPVLDVFYQQSTLNRFEIIASKAVTQTLGHILKLVYYLPLIDLDLVQAQLPLWIFPACMAAAVAGTWAGRQILERISETLFRSLSQRVILTLATVMIAMGINDFL